MALGKIRRASGHFQGRLLAIDPHRIKSSTKRQMRQHRFNADQKALKMSQCFFCLDLESCQPLCFTLASAAKTVTQATPELLELSQQILNPAADHGPLVLADTEHYSTELIDQVHLETPFELLLPMPAKSSPKLHSQALDFNPRWAGYATAKEPFRLEHSCSRHHRKIRVEKSGSVSTVVWNPWVAKAKQMPDFGDDEFKQMVCVESGNVAQNKITLAPNQSASLKVILSSHPI